MDSDKIENNKGNSEGGSIVGDVLGLSLETIKIVIISVIVIIGIRAYVMQPFFVSGSSMEPNFQDRDYLIVDEISYKLDDPKRGDVVIFRYPKDTTQFFIKRIIGLPGEKIEINNNVIKIYNKDHPNGFVVEESKYIPAANATIGNYVTELKNDEYYVLGDNRGASADSRWWGVLSRHLILGKAFLRAWPFDDIAIFENVQY
ncbi:MAG: signal peptidase I [Minisyncoccia bacterium]